MFSLSTIFQLVKQDMAPISVGCCRRTMLIMVFGEQVHRFRSQPPSFLFVCPVVKFLFIHALDFCSRCLFLSHPGHQDSGVFFNLCGAAHVACHAGGTCCFQTATLSRVLGQSNVQISNCSHLSNVEISPSRVFLHKHIAVYMFFPCRNYRSNMHVYGQSWGSSGQHWGKLLL